jgi:hypothetical protein
MLNIEGRRPSATSTSEGRLQNIGLDQLDDNSHTKNGGDAMCHGPGGDNQKTTEGEFFHLFATLCIAS